MSNPSESSNLTLSPLARFRKQFETCPPITKYTLLVCGLTQFMSILSKSIFERFANIPLFVLKYFEVYRLFTSIFVEDNIFQWIFSGILFFTMFSKQEKNYGSFLMLYRLLITTFATNVSYLICSAVVCLIKQQYYVIWNFDMSGFLPIVLALFVYDLRAYNSLGSLLSQDRLQVLIIFLSIFFLMSFSTISSVLVGAVFYFYPLLLKKNSNDLLTLYPPVLISSIASAPGYIRFESSGSHAPESQSRSAPTVHSLYDDKTMDLLHKSQSMDEGHRDLESGKKSNFEGHGHILNQ